MSFENLYLMLLLLVPFGLFAFLVLTNKDGIERVFKKKVLKRIKVEESGVSNRVRNLIIFAAIFFMIIAIGHPVLKKADREIRVDGLNIALAIDISASMRSKDRYPNRLEFAKLKIKELINSMPADSFMVLAFSNNIYLASPMSDDRYTLSEVINGIRKDYLHGGSDFTILANTLKDKLKNSFQKIAIVVSDGGDAKELEEFEKIIKKEKIKLYAILIGTKEGAPILDSSGKAFLYKDRLVNTKLNLKLGKIAKESGGDYIVASYGNDDVIKFAKKIDSNFNSASSSKTIKVKEKKELFYYFLIISVILLLIAFSSMPTKDDFKFLLKRKEEIK